MKIAVIDDEKVFRDMITNELCKEYPKKDIDCFSSAKEFLDTEDYYDLVLLDIEMPEMNGIQFAREHVFHIPCIIYVTSYADFIYDAIDINIAGFVVKHNLKTDLLPKVKEVENRIIHRMKIKFKTSIGPIMIPTSDILYFSIQYDTIYLKTMHEEYKLYETSLINILKKLDDKFINVDRNYIVNMDNVIRLDVKKNEVILLGGITISVSKRKWKNVKKLFFERVKAI